jgi:fatty-acyl-CoA synthase
VFVPKGSADEPPFVFTYAALLHRVTQAANVFHRLGVGAGDVVAYALPSLPQTHFALYGAEAAGIACAINPLLEAKHVVEILRAAGAKVLVTLGPGPGGELWDKMAAVVEQVPTLETVLQVNLAQFFVPGYVAPAAAERAHAGRRVLDFDAECAREPGDPRVRSPATSTRAARPVRPRSRGTPTPTKCSCRGTCASSSGCGRATCSCVDCRCST